MPTTVTVLAELAIHMLTPTLYWTFFSFSVKYMVQAHQFHKDHENSHFVACIFRYQREMAVDFCKYIVTPRTEEILRAPLFPFFSFVI